MKNKSIVKFIIIILIMANIINIKLNKNIYADPSIPLPIELMNGGFEEFDYQIPSEGTIQIKSELVRYWSTTATDNLIEIWHSGATAGDPPPGVIAAEGSYFVELNATQPSTLYQDIKTYSGEVLNWSLSHRGRAGIDTMQVLIGAPGSEEVQETITDDTIWKNYSGTYTVPEGQTVTRFGFKAVSTAAGNLSIGNFLDNIVFSSADLTPPTATPVPQIVPKRTNITDPNIFVKDIADNSEGPVTVSFADKPPDTSNAGEQTVPIKLVDFSGNETIINALLTVTELYWTVNERYEKSDGTKLQEDVKTKVTDSTNYTKQALKIDGYTLISIKVDGNVKQESTASISNVREDHEVLFIYDKNTFTITEKYQKIDGTKLQEDVKNSVQQGTNYIKEAPNINGYSLIDIKIDGVSSSTSTVNIENVTKNQEIIFIYVKNVYTIIEKYQKIDGTILQDDTTVKMEQGVNYKTTSPILKDYVPKDIKIDGKLLGSTTANIDDISANHEIIYLYEDNKYTITEKYINSSSESLINPTEVQIISGKNYSKEAPSIKEYTLVDIKIDGIPKGGFIANMENIQGNHEVVFIYAKKVYTITEKYQKSDGTILQNDTIDKVEQGTSYKIASPEISNYIKKDIKIDGKSIEATSGSIDNVISNHEVIFIYEDRKYTITEKYLKSDSTSLKPDTKTEIISGQNYSKEGSIIDGYTLMDIKLDGVSKGGDLINLESVQGNHEVIFVYGEKVHEITEKYKKIDGTILQETNVYKVEEGANYEKKAPIIDNYVAIDIKQDGNSLKDTSISIKNITKSYEVVFLYEDKKYKITEKYIRSDGTSLKPDTSYEIVSGENYSKQAPMIDQYTLIDVEIDNVSKGGSYANIKDVKEDHVVSFIYGKKVYQVIEKYQKLDGSILQGDTIVKIEQGRNYIKSSPVIEDYTPKDIKQDGTALGAIISNISNISSNHEVIYLYEDKKYTITEKYIKSDYTSLKPNTTSEIISNENYAKQAAIIDGYTIIDVRIDGVSKGGTLAVLNKVRGNHEVEFVYSIKAHLITERYEKEDGEVLQPSSLKWIEEGGYYIKSSQVLENYIPTKIKIDGVLNDTTIANITDIKKDHEVVYIYENKKYTRTEKYEKQDGSSIKESTETKVISGENYSKQGPILDGFTLIDVRLDGVSKGVDLINIYDVTGNHEVVFKYAKKAYIVTEKYKKEDGTILQPSNTQWIEAGTAYKKSAPLIENYVPIKATIDGTELNDTFTNIPNVNKDYEVVFIYEDNTYTIIEKYSKTDGSSINQNTESKIISGKNYFKQGPVIEGYTLIDAKLDGVSQGLDSISISNVKGNHEVEFVYAIKPHVITEKYMKSDGTILKDNTITKLEEGMDYLKPSPVIDDYIAVNTKVDGLLNNSTIANILSVNKDYEVIFIYEDKIYNITEKYEKTNGESLKENTVSKIISGQNYSKEAPSIDGYTLIDIRVDGFSKGGDLVNLKDIGKNHEVVFVYALKIHTLSEKYIKTDGTILQPDNKVNVEEGSNFVKTSPIIKDYIAVDTKIDGVSQGLTTINMTNIVSNHELTFIYEDRKYTITEKYEKSDNTSISQETISKITSNDNYSKEAPAFEGYTLVDIKLDGMSKGGTLINLQNVQGNHEVVFVYAEKTHRITEKYEKLDGRILQSSTLTEIEDRRDYKKDAPKIIDYVIAYVKIDGEPIDSINANIASVVSDHEVIFVYDDEKYTIYEEYRDLSGKSLKEDSIIEVKSNENYSKHGPLINGYVLTSVKIDDVSKDATSVIIENVKSDHRVVFIYSEKINTIYEKYEKTDGTIIKEKTSKDIENGKDYVRVAPEIDGYVPVYVKVDKNQTSSTTAKISNVTQDHEVIYVYDDKQYTIIEKYKSKDGKNLLQDNSVSIKNGENYVKDAPILDGYNIIDVQVDGVSQGKSKAKINQVDSNHNVVFIYDTIMLPTTGEKMETFKILHRLK